MQALLPKDQELPYVLVRGCWWKFEIQASSSLHFISQVETHEQERSKPDFLWRQEQNQLVEKEILRNSEGETAPQNAVSSGAQTCRNHAQTEDRSCAAFGCTAPRTHSEGSSGRRTSGLPSPKTPSVPAVPHQEPVRKVKQPRESDGEPEQSLSCNYANRLQFRDLPEGTRNLGRPHKQTP